jgi:CDP-diacylglycerol pyrophosphatase
MLMSSFAFPQRARLLVLACMAFFCFLLSQVQAHDADALWKIVDGQCRRHQLEGGKPTPCDQIDLRPGAGFAVLKDTVGIAQFLVIPTKRLTGVESPELLAQDSPNYWAYAWHVKAAVEKRLHRKMERDQVGLAINSVYGRTQNQLHIHVDCIRPDVQQSLRRHIGEIGSQWAPLGEALNGHPYWAMRLRGSELGDNDPFKLLAEQMPSARHHMDRQTLVLLGATFEDGTQGFILLDDHVDLSIGDRAHGEELLDHECAIATQ